MAWWLKASVFCLVLSASAQTQESGPVLYIEPPSRLVFSNSTGARAACVAHGSPPPAVTWQHADAAPLDHLPNLRQVLHNGTLVFLPFAAAQYRADVHAAALRCRATNAYGSVVSREMRVQAVVLQEWSARVTSSRAEVNGLALLTCWVPPAVKEYTTVVAWYKNDMVLAHGSKDVSETTHWFEEGWRLIVSDVQPSDAHAQFSCSLLDSLTGERRRSTASSIEIVSALQSVPAPPRPVSHQVWETMVRKGEPAVLPCLVNANPTAIYTWYRETAGGALREIRESERGTRYRQHKNILGISRVEIQDGGRWACRASNPHGHATQRVLLIVHQYLAAHVEPTVQVINSGETAILNCTWSGYPIPRLEWLHNGVPISPGVSSSRVRVTSNGEQLVVKNVQRIDRGVYQCMARNERDSAQASGEIRLGDTAPELQYTFIEQVLRAGQVVTLKCSATGSPLPHFTWQLDGQPLNTMARGHRYSVEQFVSKHEVVGYLNITAVRSEDGGLYTCRAANSLGEVAHTSRLNIYGTPYVRSIGPIRAVAGRELTLYCPYSGYPISSVKWERDGSPVTWAGGSEGSLHLPRVEASHAGAYTCSVAGPHGEMARRDLQLVVSNPPEIEPFSFSANLQEGKRAQVSCSVISGDMPVHFAWLKDNLPIPTSLQVEERGADFFSNLVFKEVSAQHSGQYTCVASNAAAKVNYTAELVVKVSPKWLKEPRNESILAGETLDLHCLTTGSPAPQVTWLKQRAPTSSDFTPLTELGGRFQYQKNGTLTIESAMPFDEGFYTCKADNGVGSVLSKSIYVAVNEPARFELGSHNMTARRDSPATLLCDARGDHPIRLLWSHNMNKLDLDTYRLSVSEAKTDSGLRSQLYISRTDRQDSGVYKCQATNVFGHSDHYIYLSVQEKPDTPQSLSVTEITSRAVRLSWSQGFDGNSPVVAYCIQHTPLSPQATFHANQWDTAFSYNVSIHRGLPDMQAPVTLLKKRDVNYEAFLNGLSPHTAYMIRLAAINQIDRSEFTEPVVVKTQEEAPSDPPTNVLASPGGPGEVHVAWRPPPREAWHGELIGYTVTCTEVHPGSAMLTNNTRTVTVNGWADTELNLSGLKKFTRYEIRVRAFNGVATGPSSVPVEVTTLEGVPESHPLRVSCSALSSSSMKVTWSPPPSDQHGGVIQGYKVLYSPLTSDHADVGEIKRVTTTDTYLHTLRKYTNYSIQVLAFTNAGDGKRSPPIYCLTEEDVPSAPQKIKALAFSSDSVLVSWLPPLYPNGIITHYTVYYREAGRLGKHSSFTVTPDAKIELELMFQVRNLMESQLYEFWVSATTASGEGESTLVVGQGPSSRIPARIASFGGVIVRGAGRAAVLPCACVGSPPPRSRWTHARAPVTSHRHYQVTPRGHLHIHEINEESSGNFTCTATNMIGEDSITYTVVAIMPPAPPSLSLQYATASSVKVTWQTPRNGGSPILGYLLHYKQETAPDWSTSELSPDVTSHTIDALRCGSAYSVKIQARNKVSAGLPSEVLLVSTRGGLPKPPKVEDHIQQNSTAIKVNLYAWRDNGCPISSFKMAYRKAEAEHWIKLSNKVDASSYVIGDLEPGTWYELNVEAANEAGSERVYLLVDTLTVTGVRIPPLKPSNSLTGERRGNLRTVVLSCVASGFVIVVTLVAIVCIVQGRNKFFFCCPTDDYTREDGKMSESHESEREKLRDAQKQSQYSSSTINGNDKSNDDSSAEMYEISPYATFGVAEGAHSVHYHTFARRDDDAPPPHRHRTRRHRSCDHYRYDESSLSKSSTVEMRRCVRAAAAGWREPRSDSDENSDTNTTVKGSLGSSVGGGGAGGGAGAGGSGGRRGVCSPASNPVDALPPVDISPAAAAEDLATLIDKYHKRKELERRECTIHV